MENRQFLDVEEFGASLDWMTFTAPQDTEEAGRFHRFARSYMQREQDRWGAPEEAKLRGYAGIKVNESTHVRRSYDGHEMLIASGETSNRLAEEVIIHGIIGNVRRLDGQVIAHCRRPVYNYPELLRDEILRARQRAGKEKRKKLALFDSPLGNDGITVGSRTSTRYARIYDWEAKHRKCAGGKLWRHEGEFKGDAAQAFFNGYKANSNRRSYVAGVMHATLQSMDIPCDWLKDIEAMKVVVGRKLTTDESRLEYQRKIGVPMLMQLVESGKADEVKALLKAHGLDKLF